MRTPTGDRYRSKAPPLPGLVMVDVGEMEVHIGIDLARGHAA
ncbi:MULTISPECIES: hypothetical protein [unclassified Mycolicibacterium]|nr:MULTISPECIES: hypothetical protein [unclassified Mycolicibacterium]